MNLPPVRVRWYETRSPQLRAHHLVDCGEMRKGGRLSELDKLRVVEGGLKVLDACPSATLIKRNRALGTTHS